MRYVGQRFWQYWAVCSWKKISVEGQDRKGLRDTKYKQNRGLFSDPSAVWTIYSLWTLQNVIDFWFFEFFLHWTNSFGIRISTPREIKVIFHSKYYFIFSPGWSLPQLHEWEIPLNRFSYSRGRPDQKDISNSNSCLAQLDLSPPPYQELQISEKCIPSILLHRPIILKCPHRSKPFLPLIRPQFPQYPVVWKTCDILFANWNI